MKLSLPLPASSEATQVGSRLQWLQQRAVWLPVMAGMLFYLVFIARTSFIINGEVYFSLFDDAMISMRYARNLAMGYGLVWNPGEPPVEGYTNLLWTFWMAVLHLLPVPESKISLLVMLSGVPILSLNILLVGRIAAHLAPRSRFCVALALWFTAFYYPLIYWTLRGMEVGLLTLLVSGMILLALRLRDAFHVRTLAGLAICVVLGILTRTDALVPCISVAAFAFLTARAPRRWQVALVLSGSIALTLALHTAIRIRYYGDPLPNTYYLKVEGISLMTRFSRGVSQFIRTGTNHLGPAVAVAALYPLLRRRSLHPGVYLLAAIFLGQCAYSVYVGADAWEWMQYANRYITVGMPALLVLAALGITALLDAQPRAQQPPARALADLFAVWSVVGLAGWVWSAGIGVQATAQPLLFKLVERILPGKITTLALAGLCLALFTLPRLQHWGERRFGAGLAARTWPFAGLLLAVLLFASVNGEAIALSMVRNACEVDDDAEMTRYGLALRDVTTEQASIAVARAGGISYFSRRLSVDLLGKSDRVVATSPPVFAFNPGHNKLNIVYSIGQLRPDIVAEIVGDPIVIEGFGYERVAPTVFVRTGSTQVDHQALVEAVNKGSIPRLARSVPFCLGE